MNSIELSILQGEDFVSTITVKENSFPVDLTGSTFRGDAKENLSDSRPSFSFAFDVLDQSTNKGQFKMFLTNSDSSRIVMDYKEVKSFFFDVEWIRPDGIVKKILRGKCKVTAEVTK